MNQFKVGDLVWIPDSTYGFEKPEARYRHKIKGPTYGLVVATADLSEPFKVKVSVGTINKPDVFWFRYNEIYKEDGEAYGKVC